MRTLEQLQADVRAIPMRSILVAAALLEDATVAGKWLYVTDAATGAIPCFSDGTTWRRCDTRAVVS